jgi:hypothetical protein
MRPVLFFVACLVGLVGLVGLFGLACARPAVCPPAPAASPVAIAVARPVATVAEPPARRPSACFAKGQPRAAAVHEKKDA